MQRIYCISGLGADHRIFRKLSINNYELVPVNWVPYDKHDTVPVYARKLIPQITDKDPIIIGLSFGGMLAVEIGKQIPAKKIVIISSAKSNADLGYPGHLMHFIIKYGIIPASFLSTPNRFILDRFGASTDEEKELLSDIIRASDGNFMKWALKALLTWDNTEVPPNLFHIHGAADKIIPPTHVHPDHWVEGGSHIMVYNRAAEIGKIIADMQQ